MTSSGFCPAARSGRKVPVVPGVMGDSDRRLIKEELDEPLERHNGAGLMRGKGGGVRVIGYLQMRAVGGVVEGVGFAEQEQQVREWAECHGHEVVRILSDRCSANTLSPGLSAAVRAVQAGEADALVVTSPARLGVHDALGVRILVVDEPEPVDPPRRPAPAVGGRRTIRSAVGPWVAVAAATAVFAGVAAASVEEPSSPMKGRCVSARYEVVPCNGNEMAKVLDVMPSQGCAFADSLYRWADRTWLCLQYR